MEKNGEIGKIKSLDTDFEFEAFEPDAKPHGRAIGWVNYDGKRYHFQAYFLYSLEKGERDWQVSWFAPDGPPFEKYEELVLPLARAIAEKCRQRQKEKA